MPDTQQAFSADWITAAIIAKDGSRSHYDIDASRGKSERLASWSGISKAFKTKLGQSAEGERFLEQLKKGKCSRVILGLQGKSTIDGKKDTTNDYSDLLTAYEFLCNNKYLADTMISVGLQYTKGDHMWIHRSKVDSDTNWCTGWPVGAKISFIDLLQAKDWEVSQGGQIKITSRIVRKVLGTASVVTGVQNDSYCTLIAPADLAAHWVNEVVSEGVFGPRKIGSIFFDNHFAVALHGSEHEYKATELSMTAASALKNRG